MRRASAIILGLGLLVGIFSLLRAQMRPFVARYVDFSGGFVDWFPSSNLQPNQSPNAQNLIVDPLGSSMEKRKGYVKCGDLPSGNAAVAAFRYVQTPGDEALLLSDTQNYYETVDCSSFTTVRTGQTLNAMPDCEQVYGDMWCTNGVDSVFRWNGTSSTVLDGTSWANVPKGQYIEFENRRVWVANTSGSRSSLFFTSVSNNNGEVVEPSSSTAWPAANEIFFGRDDGDTITGLKKYLGGVYVFKSKSIWRVAGEDEFSFLPERVLSNFGTRSNWSISEIDGLLHTLDSSSLYQFDGQNAQRLLDRRSALFSNIFQPILSNDQRLWDVPGDWDDGTFSNTTSTILSGTLTLSTSTTVEDGFSDGDYTQNPVWTVRAGTFDVSSGILRKTSVSPGRITTPSTLANGIWRARLYDLIGVARNAIFAFMSQSSDSCSGAGSASYNNAYYLSVSETYIALNKCVSDVNTSLCGLDNSFSSPWDVEIRKSGNSIQVFLGSTKVCDVSDSSIASSSFIGLAHGSDQSASENLADNILAFSYSNSGTWTSEKHDASTALTAWGKFNVDEAKNGETITYRVRRAATSAALDTAGYVDILPGDYVSTSTHRFTQYQVLMATSSGNNSVTPETRNIRIEWLEGGTATQVPWAFNWQNRYWLAYSRVGQTSKDRILVKSQEPLKSFMPYVGISVNAMVESNDNLYAASSGSDDILKLDQGYRDGSSAIDSFWETRDENFGLPFNYKWPHWIYTEYERTGSGNLTVSASTSSGSGWTDYTEFQSGSGRTTERSDISIGEGTTWRFRMRQNTIDDQMKVYGFTVSGVAMEADVP